MSERRLQYSGLSFWLTSAYCVLVAGFAGWCGQEFWTWQKVCLVAIPPVVVALLLGVRCWWQTPVLPAVVLPLVGGVMLGGLGLLLAAMMTAFTERWSSPGGRAALGAIVTALGFLLTWATYIQRGQAAPLPAPDDPAGREQSGLTNG